jgi:GAF domain-containing protein
VRKAHLGDAEDWLVRQHEALERVATLVARQPPTAEVFEVVTQEACAALDARMSALLRVESPNEGSVIAGWSTDETPVPVGSRGALDGQGLLGRVLRSGQRVRLEDFDDAGGAVAAQMRDLGVPAAIAGPIIIGGRIWGALTASLPSQNSWRTRSTTPRRGTSSLRRARGWSRRQTNNAGALYATSTTVHSSGW